MYIQKTYKIVFFGRVFYFIWASLLGGIGIFLFSSLFTDKAISQNHPWLLYVFVGMVIILWMAFTGYCALRAFESNARVIIGDDSFIYRGIFKTTRFPIKDIITIQHVYDRGGLKWLKISVKEDKNTMHHVKLDFTGLAPSYLTFINQLHLIAPWVDNNKASKNLIAESQRRAHFLLALVSIICAIAFFVEAFGLFGPLSGICEGSISRNEGIFCIARNMIAYFLGEKGIKVFAIISGILMLYITWYFLNQKNKK